MAGKCTCETAAFFGRTGDFLHVEKEEERINTVKKLRKILQPYMKRPIIYSCFSKSVIGLCALLLWDRLINSRNTPPLDLIETGFFFMALYFLAWAWFQYLAFDGMRTKLLTGLDQLGRKVRKHSTADMADFINEKVVTFDDLGDEEQIAAKFCSDLIVGVLYLIPCLFKAFF